MILYFCENDQLLFPSSSRVRTKILTWLVFAVSVCENDKILAMLVSWKGIALSNYISANEA